MIVWLVFRRTRVVLMILWCFVFFFMCWCCIVIDFLIVWLRSLCNEIFVFLFLLFFLVMKDLICCFVRCFVGGSVEKVDLVFRGWVGVLCVFLLYVCEYGLVFFFIMFKFDLLFDSCIVFCVVYSLCLKRVNLLVCFV